MTATPLRASDSDRQVAVDRLARHLADGRLDLQEYDTRVAKAYAAVHHDDLDALFADLQPETNANPFGANPFGGNPFATGGESKRDNEGAPFGDAFRSVNWDAVRNAPWGDAVRSGLRRGPGRMHPVLFVLGLVLAVVLASAVIGALLHALIPLLIIGAVVYLIMSRRGDRGRCRSGQARSGR